MRASVVVLAMCMLLTGTINTIATKYQDIIIIGTAPDGTPLTFRHPAVQSACMFLGESLCLIPYFIMRWRRRKAKRLNPAYVPMPAEEKRSRRIGRIMAFAVPTLCDATGTSLMNIGLFYTYASTYQMLRGTLVLFAGAFTVLILRRQLFIHHWLGMVLITAGAALVGASSVIYQSNAAGGDSSNSLYYPSASWQQHAAGAALGSSAVNATTGLHYDPGLSRVASRGMLGLADLPGMGTASSSSSGDVLLQPFASGSGLRPGVVPGLHVWSAALREGGSDVAAAPLFGDLLVVGAQMFTALQFILEEKFLVKYKVPALLAVGLEGCWGLVLCSVLLPITSLIKGPDGVPLDDAVAAVRAIFSNAQLGAAVYLSIFSIAFFNFFGVSVTKSLSGAARATIDACRTVFIWLYALHAGWESFHALEVVGFVVLISGSSLYNEIIKSCLPGTTIESVRRTPPPRHSQQGRRSRPSGAGRSSAAGGGRAGAGGAGGAAGEGGDLTTPLLAAEEGVSRNHHKSADGGGADGAPAAAAAAAAAQAGEQAGGRGGGGGGSSRAWRAPPVPLRQPAPAHARGGTDLAQSTGGSGSWAYHMARSMRLGIHTLSPQSLAAAGGLASGDGDDGGSDTMDSESDAGSSFYSSYLASSLSRSLEGGGLLSGSFTGGRGLSASGGGPRAQGGYNSSSSSQQGSFAAAADANNASSSGGGVRVLRGFEGPGAPPGLGGGAGGAAQPRAGGGAAAVGGLTASLQAAAAGGGGGNARQVRAPSPASGMPPLPRTPSSGQVTLGRHPSTGNLRNQHHQQQHQQ